jgi:hypothetical protein
MMSDWGNADPLYVELRMREMRAAAEEARRARQARGPRRLRRRVGSLLIRAGEALACPSTGRDIDNGTALAQPSRAAVR